MGLEFREGPGAFTASIPQYPGHRQLGVVVQDALGHSAQECEGRDMAVQEGLGGLGRVSLDEASGASWPTTPKTPSTSSPSSASATGCRRERRGGSWRNDDHNHERW